jgi:hypothetical protein
MWTSVCSGKIGVAYDIEQTFDGGYIVAGKEDDSVAWDAVALKFDSSGALVWRRRYGREGNDVANAVQQLADGGFILAGFTYPSEDCQAWLIRTDSVGDTLWERFYGLPVYDDAFTSVRAMPDGGFAAAGGTSSDGNAEFYLVRTDANGDTLWTRHYGGQGTDYCSDMWTTFDGGFALTGETFSFGSGANDAWLVKTDSAGWMEWSRTFGGGDWDDAFAVQQTADSGYVIAGMTMSYGVGGNDAYLVKTDELGLVAVTEYNRGSVGRCQGSVPLLSVTLLDDMKYFLPRPGRVRIQLYDASGRRCARQVSGSQPAGWHEVRFDSLPHAGSYFVELDTGKERVFSKLTVLPR